MKVVKEHQRAIYKYLAKYLKAAESTILIIPVKVKVSPAAVYQ